MRFFVSLLVLIITSWSLGLTSLASSRLVFSNEDPEIQGNVFILDVSDGYDTYDLQFGSVLDARIQFDTINDKFLINRDLDLEGNQLINFTVQQADNLSIPTCNPNYRGSFYFNIDESKLYVCDGTSWEFGDGSLLDEDDFISNSDINGATQQSIGVYVDNFMQRQLDLYGDGKYVIEKNGSIISYVKIENEAPGGASLFGIAPGKIIGLDAGNKTYNSVTLVWQAPVNTGDPITDYIIQYRLSGGTTWTTAPDGTNTNTTYEVTGLTPDTAYEFRVVATNGNLGEWSKILEEKTYINDPFFDGSVNVMNVGGATSSVVVALEANTVVTLNGMALTTLVADGDTFQFMSSGFDVLEADKPVFVAGNASNSNVVWSAPYWAGERFSFNTTRNDPQSVRIYFWEDSTVELKEGDTVLDTITKLAGENHTFTWNGNSSYQLESTGLIMAYQHSNSYIDPKPLLPASTDIIGIPSSSMSLSTQEDLTSFNGYHSNGAILANTIDRDTRLPISPQGTTSQYESEALRLTADQPIVGFSYADSNGSCAAPFLPTAMMRSQYATNVTADWVSFASLAAGTVTITEAGGTAITTLTLAQSGSNPNAPYKAYYDFGDHGAPLPAGMQITSSVPMGAWYQPDTNTGAGNDDESILFGY